MIVVVLFAAAVGQLGRHPACQLLAVQEPLCGQHNLGSSQHKYCEATVFCATRSSTVYLAGSVSTRQPAATFQKTLRTTIDNRQSKVNFNQQG
jgi:hypothetical protein